MTEKHFPTIFWDSAFHRTILLSGADILLKNRNDKSQRYLMAEDSVCQEGCFPLHSRHQITLMSNGAVAQ